MQQPQIAEAKTETEHTNNPALAVKPRPGSTVSRRAYRRVHPLRHSLGGRILAGYLAMAFISLIVALAAIIYTNQAGNNLSNQIQLDQKVTDGIRRLELAVEQQFNAVRGILLGELDQSTIDKELSDARAEYDDASFQLNSIFDSLNISRTSFSEVQALYQKFTKQIEDIRNINLEIFKKTAIVTYEKSARTMKQDLSAAIDSDLKVYRNAIGKEIKAAQDQAGFITLLSLALVLIATVGGIVVASLITRSITKPLRELASVADSIRKDDLSVTMPQPRGDDEVASLSGAMGRMAENLRISRERLQNSLTETKRRNRELTAVNRVIATISGSLNLDQILGDTLEEMLAVSEMEFGSIYLMEQDGEYLRLVEQRNQTEEYISLFGRVKVGDQLTGQVARTGEVIFTNNVSGDERITNEVLRTQLGRVSYLGIPLATSGRVVGVLNLTSTQVKNFSENDLVLYKAIGSQVGIAVENAQLYAQAQQLAALEERNRLARDLHDSVTQTLFSITLTAESARAMMVKKPERVAAQLERLQNLARGALAEMRALIFQLRPAALEEQGLVQALEKHIASVRSKEGLQIEFVAEGERRLSNEQEQALYRIAQEALNNIVKHAQATRVDVKLVINDEIATLGIQDNGVGFDTGAPATQQSQDRKSLGMTSMRERAELAGGQIQIDSKPGEGTRITVVLPLIAAPRPVGIGIN